MVEANQSYHPQLSEQSRAQIVRAIIAIALWEARKEIKQTIQREGKVKLRSVPVRDITAMAKAMVEANPAEWLAKAKASSVGERRNPKASCPSSNALGQSAVFGTEALARLGLRLGSFQPMLQCRSLMVSRLILSRCRRMSGLCRSDVGRR